MISKCEFQLARSKLEFEKKKMQDWELQGLAKSRTNGKIFLAQCVVC